MSDQPPGGTPPGGRNPAPRLQLQLDEEQMIPFSATTNVGRDDLASAVVSLVAQPSWRNEDPSAR